MLIIHYENMFKIFHYFIAYQEMCFYFRCFLKFIRNGLPKVLAQFKCTSKVTINPFWHLVCKVMISKPKQIIHRMIWF